MLLTHEPHIPYMGVTCGGGVLVSYAMRTYALIALLAVACTRAPQTSQLSSTSGFSAEIVDGVSRLRAATSKYLDLDSAVAAGYPKTVAQCLVHEHHGAMGYHHMNRNYVDSKVEIDKPEILLYERMADSSFA